MRGCPVTSRGRDCEEHPARPELVEDVRRELNRLAVLTTIPGATLLAAFLSFLVPISIDPDQRGSQLLLNGIVLAVYLPVTLAIGRVWADKMVDARLRWLYEGRRPTEAEREATLHVPVDLVKIPATFWGLGAVLFGLLQLRISLEVASVIFDSICLGGVTAGALGYLLSERVWRPVAALTLAEGPPSRPLTPGVRARLTMAWGLATGVPLIGIFALGSAGVFGLESDPPELLPAAVMFLVMIALGTGLLATHLVARSIADPLAAVREALARVEKGELDAQVAVDDGSEVGLLGAGFNRMAVGLRERERLRELFGRQVGQEVADAALDGEIEIGGEVRRVGVLFVDILGSTALASDREPTEVVGLLNSFFEIVVGVVDDHSGWVNKFEGDAALCVFGAPVSHPDPAGAALGAARDLRERLRQRLPKVEAGIGVSAGEAVAGNVGAERRYEYTVIGDPVNEAARLCELAKRHPDHLLASDVALEMAADGETSRWELGEEIVLRGRSSPTRLATLATQKPLLDSQEAAATIARP